MDVKSIDNQYVAHTYSRFDLNIVKGKGALLYDDKDNEYIDLATGIAVNTFGVCDDEWKQAVINQLNKVQHTSNLYYSEPCALLARELATRTSMCKVFFGNSGAEANECAIKVARKYAQDKKGKDYYNIITLKNSFHGRTLTTLSATGQDVFHQLFTPLTPGFLYATANDIDSVKRLIAEYKVAGIMMEMVQGEGGVLALEKEFVVEVSKLCKDNDIVLICDEVQCGNGRTGELYGYMNFGIKPDVFTTAKGLGGGLPIGACVLGEKVENVLTPSTHGSTFGGNPIACAGALSVLKRIDEKLLCEVKEKSRFIFDELKGASGIKSVSGLGFMIGIETETDAEAIRQNCEKQGVLVIKAKNKVRLLPPLNIEWSLLKKAVKVIKNACKV